MSSDDFLVYVEEVYNTANDTISDISTGSINAENIFLIITQLMLIVESYPELNGVQKQDIVIGVLKMAVAKSPIEDDERMIVNIIIDRTAPIVIRQIIRASRGELDLNKVVGCFKSIWRKIKCC